MSMAKMAKMGRMANGTRRAAEKKQTTINNTELRWTEGRTPKLSISRVSYLILEFSNIWGKQEDQNQHHGVVKF